MVKVISVPDGVGAGGVMGVLVLALAGHITGRKIWMSSIACVSSASEGKVSACVVRCSGVGKAKTTQVFLRDAGSIVMGGGGL